MESHTEYRKHQTMRKNMKSYRKHMHILYRKQIAQETAEYARAHTLNYTITGSIKVQTHTHTHIKLHAHTNQANNTNVNKQ